MTQILTLRGTTTFLFAALLFVAQNLWAQPKGTYFDESRVPEYQLPPLLRFTDGRPVSRAEQWDERRAEIQSLFEEYMYGKVPGELDTLWFDLVSEDSAALDGQAIRRQVDIHFTTDEGGPSMSLLLYLPIEATQPVPVFLGLNFFGNHSIHPDTAIHLSERWMRANDEYNIVNHQATEASRGVRAHRWPVERLLDSGYGLATVYCGDLDPDKGRREPEDFSDGVHPLFYQANQTQPQPNEWGAIGAWAWGLQRALDYLETDEQVRADQVAVFGHSRLAKAALWAGAQDERFALIISNNAGCGGAALSRRGFGETVASINQAFPHWFNDRFPQYNGREDELPVDQHMLVAMLAPRPVYVASATDDLWADPRGEFLATQRADSVYQLLGTSGLPTRTMPAPDKPVVGNMGYHLRSGPHDLTEYDWAQYVDFANQHFKRGEYSEK